MNNKVLIGAVATESLLVLVLSGFLVFGKEPSPIEIYNDSLYSVVELKASSGTLESYGTAVCIDTGYFITNFHIVSYTFSGEDMIYESLSLRSAYEEEYHSVVLADYDAANDLAILVLEDANQFKPIEISSDRPEAGKSCFAIGNAENMGISITKGMVSSSSVIINDGETDRDFIQLDITLTNGSSGGALLDEKGQLIGINTLRLKNDSGDVIYGYAYAIPIVVVNEFLANHN